APHPHWVPRHWEHHSTPLYQPHISPISSLCASPPAQPHQPFPHHSPPPSTTYQIGSDGGYLQRPAVRSSLLVALGERYDILVDFSSLRSSCADVILTNNARAPFPAGEPVTNDTAVVMRFIVDHHSPRLPAPRIPRTLMPVPPVDTSQAVLERWITAVEESDPATGLPIRLLLGGLPFSAPPTETPRENTEELWHVINTTPDAHPIHLHLIQHRPLPPGTVLTLWTPWYSQ
ncbi:unnamed protein product, partial [Closterium sp. NIES-54]